MLEQLCIGHNNRISENALVNLLAKLSTLKRFSKLSLNGLKPEEPAINSLCHLAKTLHLSELMLGETGIGTEGALLVIESLFHGTEPNSVKLDLSYCDLTSEYVLKLNAAMCPIRRLHELNLVGNPIGGRLTPFSSPFIHPKTTTSPLKRMENDNKFCLNSSSPQNLLSRRDLLLSATAAVSAIPSSSAAGGEFPIKLQGIVRKVVNRPRKSRSKREKEEEEEVLVIDGIEFDSKVAVKFDVYVNDECSDGGGGPATSEFAGSMVNVPHGRGRVRTSLRLGITDLIDDVGADDDDSLLVTLVPKSGVGLVSVGDIGIQLLS